MATGISPRYLMQKFNPFYRHRWEASFTAAFTLITVAVTLMPFFLRSMPELLTALIIASLLQGMIGGILPIWTITSSVGRLRGKYILNSAFPFLISIGIGLLSVLLMQGSSRLVPLYGRFLEMYQGIQTRGLDRMMAVLLMTTTNLRLLWPILLQFGAVLLSWSLWLANGFLLYDIARQNYRYDGVVTFPRQWLVSFLAGFLMAVLLAVTTYLG